MTELPRFPSTQVLVRFEAFLFLFQRVFYDCRHFFFFSPAHPVAGCIPSATFYSSQKSWAQDFFFQIIFYSRCGFSLKLITKFVIPGSLFFFFPSRV